VDKSPSRETDSHLLWDQKVHCHIHNSPSLYFVTSFCSAVAYRRLLYAGSTPFVSHQQLSFVVIQLAVRLVALCRYQTTLQNEDGISSCYRQQYTQWVCTRRFFLQLLVKYCDLIQITSKLKHSRLQNYLPSYNYVKFSVAVRTFRSGIWCVGLRIRAECTRIKDKGKVFAAHAMKACRGE